ncbi:hypothetical protein E2A64_07325 [Pseudohoeflea suaedae]|uniref:Uncharacterized protein n=1 Tax=Pseudohoeflea suaedae TaxID=877384 RepID=A0A4R5PPC0_9HYPH|nr:hypothetical protein [Pseudohoeflea suaedae]TDH38896.1 hypothetical protein E2A64_07325 [Pseudohoeflea suaedae]
MRLIALLVAIAGALMAFGYTAWIDLGSGAEIGRYSVATIPAAPSGPTLTLSAADAPVGIYLTAAVPNIAERPAEGPSTAVYALTVTSGAEVVERRDVSFRFTYPANDRALKPSRPRQTQLALLVDPMDGGPYRISVARRGNGVKLASVVLSVRRKAVVPDERIAPAGFLLLVIGGVAFTLMGRRRKPGSDPRPPRSHRWGR